MRNTIQIRSFPSLIIMTVALFMMTSCSREEVQVLRVPKEPSTSKANDMSQPIPRPPTPTERLEWTAPSNWEKKPVTNIRYGSFAISGSGKQADLSIISLAGEAGGALANINRWRAQLGLPPITASDLPQHTKAIDVSGTQVVIVDIVNNEVTEAAGGKLRMLAAILPHGASTWFFKMTGDDVLVASQKPAFIQFLKSLRFTGQVDVVKNEEPASMVQQTSSSLKWKIPAGWKEQPASGMRKGSFIISGEKQMHADVSIVDLQGAAGGLLGNVNRWRGQISLPPFTEAELQKTITKMKVRNESVLFVDMVSSKILENEQNPTRILAAILVRGNRTWFFKMMGDAPLVEKQKTVFTNFVKTAELPHD
jgi:hypothetical protein